MKKTYLVLTCFCSLLITGCASKPEAGADLLPELEYTEPSTEETTDISDIDETEKSDINEDSTETSQTEDFLELTEPSDEPELEDIDEPVVITLDPVEPEESQKEDEPSQETEEDLSAQEEPIEVETPPVIEDLTVSLSDSENKIEEQSENINVETDNDNVDLVSDDDDVLLIVDSAENNDDVIDVSDDSQEDTSDAEPVEEIEIIPSRKVTVKKQEYIDITYPGNGWIYMGLVDGSKDLSYFGRKLGTADTKFTLQAKNAGTKIVHFYKNDQLTGKYIDDYIEIEVLAEKGSNKDHVAAPPYKQPVPAKAKEILKPKKADKETVSSESEAAVTPAPAEVPAAVSVPAANIKTPANEEVKSEPADKTDTTIDTNVLLKEAEVLYNEKEFKFALEKINLFFEHATVERDKALFLKGQILEAKSELQDIKGAMDAYNTLIKNYPASLLWDDANKRVIYLKRFYFGG